MIETLEKVHDWVLHTMKIKGWSARKWAMDSGVGPSTLQRFIKEKPKVFTITSFSDSGVKLKFVGVTLPGKQWDVRTKLIREIK